MQAQAQAGAGRRRQAQAQAQGMRCAGACIGSSTSAARASATRALLELQPRVHQPHVHRHRRVCCRWTWLTHTTRRSHAPNLVHRQLRRCRWQIALTVLQPRAVACAYASASAMGVQLRGRSRNQKLSAATGCCSSPPVRACRSAASRSLLPLSSLGYMRSLPRPSCWACLRHFRPCRAARPLCRLGLEAPHGAMRPRSTRMPRLMRTPHLESRSDSV